jgi:hypothetical protein
MNRKQQIENTVRKLLEYANAAGWPENRGIIPAQETLTDEGRIKRERANRGLDTVKDRRKKAHQNVPVLKGLKHGKKKKRPQQQG